jgi:hypothetical protein
MINEAERTDCRIAGGRFCECRDGQDRQIPAANHQRVECRRDRFPLAPGQSVQYSTT